MNKKSTPFSKETEKELILYAIKNNFDLLRQAYNTRGKYMTSTIVITLTCEVDPEVIIDYAKKLGLEYKGT